MVLSSERGESGRGAAPSAARPASTSRTYGATCTIVHPGMNGRNGVWKTAEIVSYL
jgi:hypothetical protein